MNIGTNRTNESPVELPSTILNKHVAMLGSTGSGKTVAAKILIEEATLNGIPSVIIDPQGDLSRLAIIGNRATITEKGGDADRSRAWEEKAEVRIWTPTKESGLPICLDPFQPPVGELKRADLQAAWDMMASGFTILARHDIEKGNGAQVKAFLNELLMESARHGQLPGNFVELSKLVATPSSLIEHGGEENWVLEIENGFIKASVREELSRRFNALDSGVSQLMFSLGVPMDIETLIEPSTSGKIPVNILYLNSLGTDNLRHSFLQEFGRRLYDWMLKQKSDNGETNLLFFIDEVAPYLPSEPRRPPAKEIIKLLFKQGRKFGLSCILATQNIADVDYKILGQANTRFIGRFKDKQDISKIKHLLKGKGGDPSLIEELPKLKDGEFQLVCPDFSEKPTPLNLRWLYTDHGSALSEDEVEELTPKSLRDWAKDRSVKRSRPAIPPAIPLSREEMSRGLDGSEQPFESHLMGGLMLLRDPKDPLSVMLGATNILTAGILLMTTFILGQSWIDGDSSGYLPLIGSLISLISCTALGIETLLGDDLNFVQRIRQRARPIQYIILVWIWVLWFGNRADWYDLDWSSRWVDVAQTVTTLFVVLEMAHRIRLSKIQMQLDRHPLTLMKEAMHSLRIFLSESEIATMRATSHEVMQTLRGLTDLVTACLLGFILFDVTYFTVESMFSSEIVLRLFAIYALQIFARVYVSMQSESD